MEALTKVESDVSFASRQLENAFKQSVQNGGAHIPNPVITIRKLTTLELAMTQLRKDCENISKKRQGIVRSVVTKQSQNVQNVEKLLQDESLGTSERYPSLPNGCGDQDWDDLTNDLNKQCRLLTANNG